MKGKRLKEKNNRISSIIVLLAFILFICVFIYSSIQIFNWIMENNARKAILSDIQDTIKIDEEKENVEKYSVDLLMIINIGLYYMQKRLFLEIH